MSAYAPSYLSAILPMCPYASPNPLPPSEHKHFGAHYSLLFLFIISFTILTSPSFRTLFATKPRHFRTPISVRICPKLTHTMAKSELEGTVHTKANCIF